MFSSLFINRPIFASVIAILITLAGISAATRLPVEHYPLITPPVVQVSAFYTGANAEVVSETVAAPLEQQINGVENMIYMQSQSTSAGEMGLTVFFEIGSDIDKAQMDVQNNVNLVLPKLPQEVIRLGVSVEKQSSNILMIITMESPNGRYDDIFLSNYASLNIVNELKRVKGVSQVQIIGGRDYSMRIWLKPDRMAELGITTKDVVAAIQDQNALFALGQIGQEPNTEAVQLTLPVNTLGRLSDTREFENIIIRASPDGSFVLLKDIGRAELGAQDYSVIGKLNGKTTTLIAVYKQFEANALFVAEDVKKLMTELNKDFPADISYSIPYDTTKFIKASIREVTTTMIEACILVVAVVFIFLQNFRATLIPLIAMVVSIIGTFAGMYVLGFSVNTLTMFGMVLAIGIVVDDAIVVVENVDHNMRKLNLSAKDAAFKAMHDVSGPVIAIVFVLCAVFLPVAFLGGIAGQLYKQFAITITISVVISGLIALTLSPALAAILLKIKPREHRIATWFNKKFDNLTDRYIKGTSWLLLRPIFGVISFFAIIILLVLLFYWTPTSFVPEEDQGYLMAASILPDGSSLNRTVEVDSKITNIVLAKPEVESNISFSGYSLLEGMSRTSRGANFIVLKDWNERRSKSQKATNVLKRMMPEFSAIEQANVMAFNPPAIQGLGTVGGFEFWVENRGNTTVEGMADATQALIAEASKNPAVTGLFSSLEVDNMQIFIDLDRYRAKSLGVTLSDVYQALQTLLGSLYINDFNIYGRVFRVIAQAEPAYRSSLDSLDEIYIRSDKNEMIPIKSLLRISFSKGPTLLSRFNGFPAVRINGSAAPGYSSGEAMTTMENIAREVLPEGMTFAWSGSSYQEKKAGSASVGILVAGLVMVFLILAALYENWSIPLAVILAVPFGALGAFTAVWLAGMSNDVYFQVGLVTLIGLSAKNAILIVEFAMIKRNEGMPVVEAALEAARLRFRAILMTSLTFIFGVIPLVISTGAGAAGRNSVGTGVLGGMIGATLLALFFVPLFFTLIAREKKKDV